MGARGVIAVAALVGDVLRALGEPVAPSDLAPFRATDAKKYRNWLSAVAIACWLLNDSWFHAHRALGKPAYRFLTQTLAEMATFTNAPKFSADADRREEIARMCLQDLGMRPAGETLAQAQDRLTTLSAAERQRVMRAAQHAEQRARAIREAMAKQAAQEAADKAARE